MMTNIAPTLPLILLGGGGHFKVLCDAIRQITAGGRKLEIAGFVDDRTLDHSALRVSQLGAFDAVERLSPERYALVNAVGSEESMAARKAVFDRFKALGFMFATIVHPSAVIAGGVCFGEGVQVMAGAVLQVDTVIGDNTIINTRASVDHDCTVGAHCHIAPGVCMSGHVHVADEVHLGVGATVIQWVEIGKGSTVGAGAVVIRAVAPGAVVVGSPARPIAR